MTDLQVKVEAPMTPPQDPELFDVIAVNIKTRAERVIAEGKTWDNADAIVGLCTMRLGVEDEFFITRPAGEAK